jgi:predicted TIM-barrel fold metal-dependent hydrolase
MPQSLIDSHIHFSSHDRLNELQRYCREIGAEKVCALSLPLKQRINFNPEILFAKAHLGPICYGLASFDYSPLFFGGAGGGGGGRRSGSDRGGGTGEAGGSGAAALDLVGQVERFRELGFDGLKIYLGKPSFQSLLGLKLDDPEVIQAFKRAESLEMPVLIHIADPLIFWSYECIPGFIPPGWEQALAGGGGGIPSYEDLQAQVLEVLKACPGLTVIFPHLLSMGQDIPRLAEILKTYPRVFLDLAPGLYYYYELDRQRDAAREFFARYSRRILFGTDAFWFPSWFSEFPNTSVEDNLARARCLLAFLSTEERMDNPFVPTQRICKEVRGLGLGEDIMRRIRTDNFKRLYPATPRRIEADACLRYLDDFLNRLNAVAEEEEIPKSAAELKRSLSDLFKGRKR